MQELGYHRYAQRGTIVAQLWTNLPNLCAPTPRLFGSLALVWSQPLLAVFSQHEAQCTSPFSWHRLYCPIMPLKSLLHAYIVNSKKQPFHITKDQINLIKGWATYKMHLSSRKKRGPLHRLQHGRECSVKAGWPKRYTKGVLNTSTLDPKLNYEWPETVICLLLQPKETTKWSMMVKIRCYAMRLGGTFSKK